MLTQRAEKNPLVRPVPLVLVVVSCLPALLFGQEESSVQELEKELYQAVRGGLPDVAIDRLKALVRIGDIDAYRAIIGHGLSGGSYEVEKYAGNLLVNAESPEVRGLVLTQAGSHRNYRTRIVLLAVAARWAASSDGRGANAAALQVLHDAVGDRSRPVAFIALKWLRELRKRESIGPLITRLAAREKRRKDRLYYDILKTLEILTGYDFKFAADWLSWWDTARDLKKIPKKAPNTKRESKTKTVLYKPPPTFFSVPVDSDRVLFVIDVSQSMLVRDPELPPELKVATTGRGQGSAKTAVVEVGVNGRDEEAPPLGPPPPSRERLHRVKTELMSVIEALPEKTHFGILSFSHELRIWGAGSSLRSATRVHKADAISWVKSLRAYGATRTDKALMKGLSFPELDTLYLLTDGRPRDENNRKIPVEPVLQLVKRENRFQKCRINTISFQQVKSREMKYFVQELAKQNDGLCTLLR